MRMPRLLAATSLFATILLVGPAAGQPRRPLLAPSPPMGWNSWDAFGTSVSVRPHASLFYKLTPAP